MKRFQFLLGCSFLAVLCMFVFCGKPQYDEGSMQIQIGDIFIVENELVTIDFAHCVVMNGLDQICKGDLLKTDVQFEIKIEDLKPSNDYSVLLIGEKWNGETIGRVYIDQIRVKAGDVTHLNLTWDKFELNLISPGDGSTLHKHSPTYKWESCFGVVEYTLQVNNLNDFSYPIVDDSNIVSTEAKPSIRLRDGTYYWRVRGRDIKHNWSRWSSTYSFNIVPYDGSPVTDIDGNVYQVIQIGNQWWMATNLKVTRYRNGEPIPNVTDNTNWSNLTTGAYCNFGNDEDNGQIFGFLYNGHAVYDSRNIAPVDWHVPNEDDWIQLEVFLGMSLSEAYLSFWHGTDEGGKLKEAGTSLWASPNTGATNESGFTAIPGGYRDNNGYFSGLGYNASFWSSVEYASGMVFRYLSHLESRVYNYRNDKRYGFSIRCILDS